MKHNTTQHNTTQHNTTQHNTTQHNTTQHNTTNHYIISSLNGHINNTPLVGFTDLNSEPGAIYSLLDANTNKTPQGLKFHQEQNLLIVEHNGKRILALKGFFVHKENPAKFVVDKAADGTVENIITADATVIYEEDGRAYIIASEPLLVANSEQNTTNPVAPVDTTAEAEPDFLTDNWVWFAVGGAIILAGVAGGGSSSSSGKKDSSTDKPKPDEPKPDEPKPDEPKPDVPDTSRPTLESIKATGNTIMLTYNEALDGDHLPEASTFAIQVIGGANNPVTAVAISDSGDAIILTLTNPIAKGSNFTIAYTDPTTGDDTNAIQDEQGNDASTFNSKTGLVVDGYIQGAQLYADYNNNGIAEDDEILEGVITDEFGRFFLTTDINAPLIAVGGTNTDTGIENTLTMRAPEGAMVINPITTVVQQYLNDNEGTSLEQAETAVKEILGIALPVGERLSDYEPISSKNQEMQEIAAQIVEVAMQAETTKAGDGSTVFENIAAARTPLDLTTTDDVTTITKGTDITAETVQALVMQTTNIKDTDSIADIATQQKSLIVALTDDTGLEDDDLNSSVGTIEVTRKFTGNIQYSIDDGVIWTDDFDAEEGDNNLQVRQVDAEGKVLSAITTFAFILDSTAPTIVITDNTEDAAIGDVTYSFTFSEAVMGFAAGDITVSGGSKGLFSKIDGRTYQLVVTPATDSTTQITVDVKAGVVTDIAGNANTAAEQSVQQVQVVDPAIPTVVISRDLNPGYPEASGLGYYSIKFSEAVTGFTSEDVTIIGGRGSNYFKQIDDVTYRLVVQLEINRTEPVTIGIKADVAKDADGNGNYAAVPLVDQIDSETLVVTEVKISDDTGRSVTDFITKTASQTITANLGKPLAKGEIFIGSVTVNEDGRRIIWTDITEYVEGTKISWKVDFLEGNNEIVFFINRVVYREVDPSILPVYNSIVASTPINYTLDTASPTVAITDSGADPATGAVTYTFTFSEDVFGFTADSIEVTGGAKGTLKTLDDNIYTLTVTPPEGSKTPITVDIKADTVTDIAGNVSSAIPTVVISKELDSGYPETSGLGFYSIKFSEAVTGFTYEDITVTGGRIDHFDQIDDVTYRLVVKLEFDRTEPVTIGIKADIAKDVDDNGNYAAVPLVDQIYSETFVVTEVKISDDTGSSVTDFITKTVSQTITANLDKPLAEGGRLYGSVTATKGVRTWINITDHVEGTKISWKVDLLEGNNEIVFVKARTVENEVGPDIFTNLTSSISSTPINYTLDTASPTVAITDSGADPATGAVAYTFRFSEDVFGFTADSIEVTGGAKGTLKTIGDDTYTLTVTPPKDSKTPITVDIKADVVTDIAGNGNVSSTVPTVVISKELNSGYPETSGLGFYSIKFSEAVTGFTSEDVTVTGGRVSYLRDIDDVTYRVVVQLDFDRTEPVTIGIKADIAKDVDDNGNYAAVPLVDQIDSETLVVTEVKISDDTGISVTDFITETASQTITANLGKPLAEGEHLWGAFTANKNGRTWTDITEYVEGTKISWKVDLLEGNNEIVFTTFSIAHNEVDPEFFPDLGGFIGSTPINYTLDTTAPTVVMTDDADGSATGVVTYTFRFSEDVFGFTADSIEVTGGAKGTLKIIGNNTYALTVTPPTGSTTPITAVVKEDGSITDIAGNKFGTTTVVDIPTGKELATMVADVPTGKEIDRSIVIFDLTTGKSSTHSDRKFTAEVTDIYIIVHAEPSKLELNTAHRWSSDGELTAGIKIHMITADGEKAVTVGGNPIAQSVAHLNYIGYTAKGENPGGTAIFSEGNFVQEIKPDLNTIIRLWTGQLVLTKGSFGGTIASGVLTSQGLI